MKGRATNRLRNLPFTMLPGLRTTSPNSDRNFVRVAVVAAAFVLLSEPVAAVSTSTGEPHPFELVKHSDNPLGRVVSLQVAGNVSFDKGAYERTESSLRLTATVPFDLPGNRNLFIHSQVPLISQPIGPTDRAKGLGDLTVTTLFSPAERKGWTFGFGPSMVFPTATGDTLGQGKFDVGPAVAVVKTKKEWIAGVLIAQNWSVTGSDSRPGTSRLLISPFGTWYINKGWYLLSNTTVSADWKETSSGHWTVPLGGGVGHIVRRGKHAFNFTAQAYVNVIRPDDAARWQFRLTTGWVFPR